MLFADSTTCHSGRICERIKFTLRGQTIGDARIATVEIICTSPLCEIIFTAVPTWRLSRRPCPACLLPVSLSDLQMRPDMPRKSEGMPGKAADEGRWGGLGKDAPVSLLLHLASSPELQVVIRNTAAWSRSPY